MRVNNLVAFAAAACVAFATSTSDAGAILIGDGVNNGFFSDTSNPTATVNGNPEPVTTNAGGRALINSSNTSATLFIDSWTANRVGYNGGNAAFGYDAAGGSGPNGGRTTGSVPYAFVNAGQVDFVADPVPGPFSAGAVFDLDFGAYTQNAGTHSIIATLDFDGGETFTFAPHAAPAASGAFNTFSDSYTLLAPSSSVTLTLRMDSTSNGQFTMDDVQLSVVPEPGTVALILMGLVSCGAVRMRRTLG